MFFKTPPPPSPTPINTHHLIQHTIFEGYSAQYSIIVQLSHALPSSYTESLLERKKEEKMLLLNNCKESGRAPHTSDNINDLHHYLWNTQINVFQHVRVFPGSILLEELLSS